MNKFTIATCCFFLISAAVACDVPWQKCWYGQTPQGLHCQGEVILLSAFDAKQALRDDSNLRLPTRAELETFFMSSHAVPLREHAHELQNFQVLTSEFVQHGNEFLVTTVDIRNGRIELLPWREPALVLLRETKNP
ncbi:hypothetical protein LG272_03870 [Pseudidiomarina marina]|uniref:hypothetical protein n=1 Tax=Pseudidiomarina marina TaxID=502366 RepID=UPI00384E6EE9